MRPCAAVLICLMSAACSDGKSPTQPTQTVPPLVAPPLVGRWEGTWNYDRSDPPNCIFFTLSSTPQMCSTAPVTIVLTLRQDAETIVGSLDTRIYGDGGASYGPFPLAGQSDGLGGVTLAGQRPGYDPSCDHNTMRYLRPWTLRRGAVPTVLEGDFVFDGDQFYNSCRYIRTLIYSKLTRLRYISP